MAIVIDLRFVNIQLRMKMAKYEAVVMPVS
jgi:hypothetical protein